MIAAQASQAALAGKTPDVISSHPPRVFDVHDATAIRRVARGGRGYLASSITQMTGGFGARAACGDAGGCGVMDGSGRYGDPVQAADRFLGFLSSSEKSPNTVKSYAHDLKDWFCYMSGRGLAWDEVTLEDVASFVYQARTWHSFHRHTVLSMCAQALLAVAAARPAPPAAQPPAAGQPQAWRDTGKLPASADDQPPGDDPGLVKVSAPEARRLLRLAATPMSRAARDLGYAWSRWRRRHQARARWHHYHAQLQATRVT